MSKPDSPLQQGMSAMEPGHSQTGKVVQETENDGARVKAKGVLEKAAEALGVKRADAADNVKKESSKVATNGSAGNEGASGDAKIHGTAPRI